MNTYSLRNRWRYTSRILGIFITTVTAHFGGSDFVQAEEARSPFIRISLPARLLPNDITAMQFSPDFHYLAIGLACGEVKVWDIDANMEATAMWTHSVNQSHRRELVLDKIVSLLYSTNGKILIARNSSTIKAWTTTDGKELYTREDKPTRKPGMRLSDDGASIITMSETGYYYIGGIGHFATTLTWLNIANGRKTREIHVPWGKDTIYSPPGKSLIESLVASSIYDAAQLRNAEALEQLHLAHTSKFVAQVELSSDGQLLSSRTYGGQFDRWNVASRRENRSLEKLNSGGKDVGFIRRRQILYRGNGNWALRNISTGKVISGEGAPIAISADGKTFVIAAKHIEIWNAITGEKKALPVESFFLRKVALSQDGKYCWIIKWGDRSGNLPVEVWNTDTVKKVRELNVAAPSQWIGL